MKDERITVHFRLNMNGPASDRHDNGDRHSDWNVSLVTRFPDDRKLGTLFGDGWANYADYVKYATWCGMHIRDILNSPVGHKRPEFQDDYFNDGVLAHAEALRRAYFVKRHEYKVARRISANEAKWERRRWIKYRWAKSKRELAKIDAEFERRRAAGVTTLPGGFLKQAVADWRVDLGWDERKPEVEGDVISLDDLRKPQ